MNLKQSYINTLIKKHFEKGQNDKKQIILKADLPKKRNEIKKIYREMIKLVTTELEKDYQKYIYILILKILEKYKSIKDKEMNSVLEMYRKQKQKNIGQKNDNNVNKDKIIKNYEKKENEKLNCNACNLILSFLSLIFVVYYIYNTLEK